MLDHMSYLKKFLSILFSTVAVPIYVPLSAPALKRGPNIRPSPLPPWDALKDSTSASDTASLFISNPFFPAWQLLTSLPGQENPHSGRTTSRYFQTCILMTILEFCGSSRTLHLGMLGWSLPAPVRKSHMGRQNAGEGIQNSSCFPCHLVPMALLSPHGSSLLISEAALLRVEPHVSSQMAAPSSDGSWEDRPGHVSPGCCGRRPWP